MDFKSKNLLKEHLDEPTSILKVLFRLKLSID